MIQCWWVRLLFFSFCLFCLMFFSFACFNRICNRNIYYITILSVSFSSFQLSFSPALIPLTFPNFPHPYVPQLQYPLSFSFPFSSLIFSSSFSSIFPFPFPFSKKKKKKSLAIMMSKKISRHLPVLPPRQCEVRSKLEATTAPL